MGAGGSFLGQWSSQCVKLATHHHLVPSLILSAIIPLFPPKTQWCEWRQLNLTLLRRSSTPLSSRIAMFKRVTHCEKKGYSLWKNWLTRKCSSAWNLKLGLHLPWFTFDSSRESTVLMVNHLWTWNRIFVLTTKKILNFLWISPIKDIAMLDGKVSKQTLCISRS